MNLPFCDKCKIAKSCIQDLSLFKELTGNKRVPTESFCREQYKKENEEMGDFFRNVMLESTDNPSSLLPVFPELKEPLDEIEQERIDNLKKMCERNGQSYDDLEKREKLNISVTLMLTEKCNLACEYCYERFSGNVKPKSMSYDIIKKSIDTYVTPEILKLHSKINWDFIGGEIFVEFEQLKFATQYLIDAYIKLGLCPRQNIVLSLCTNGTNFTPEVKEWLLETKNKIGHLSVGLSLDGIKECHDLCRNKSFDKVMKDFQWWRENFPNDSIKGTISPKTLKYLFENVKFYVDELKLPNFYINPTFEGPWTDEDAELYSEELIKCSEFFLDKQDYNVIENSNIFMRMDIKFEQNRKGNWCGSGVYMRAISPDGIIYPCLRAVTSEVAPIGTLDTGIDKNKLLPFYLYTEYNEDKECSECEIRNHCPSCAMQWLEDTGDLFYRSKKLCLMTRVRYHVSKFYYEHTDKFLMENEEIENVSNLEKSEEHLDVN